MAQLRCCLNYLKLKAALRFSGRSPAPTPAPAPVPDPVDFNVSIFEADDANELVGRNPDGDNLEITPAELEALVIRTDLDNVNGVESVVFSIPETGFEFTDNNGNFLLNARQGLDLVLVLKLQLFFNIDNFSTLQFFNFFFCYLKARGKSRQMALGNKGPAFLCFELLF